jgi:putative peptide zinc metalloprotease protein
MDAERILRPLAPLARALFSPTGAVLWLVWVGVGVVLAAVHWHDLTHDLLDRILAPKSILVLVLLFPLIKALHELGHGMAVKAFGGEVHEIGLMLLVVTPVPYVDASGASSFRGKWQRIVVGGAGMAVELALATGALLIWLLAETGLVRMLAYNAILIAGLSTILFNANPLLRYDGYYMLADFLEIPNLRARGTRYLGYLCERYLFGRRGAEPGPSTPGERVWFVLYSVASFVYRIFVVVAIVLFLGEKLFLLAVVFAAVGAIGWILVPVGQGVHLLRDEPPPPDRASAGDHGDGRPDRPGRRGARAGSSALSQPIGGRDLGAGGGPDPCLCGWLHRARASAARGPGHPGTGGHRAAGSRAGGTDGGAGGAARRGAGPL